GQRDARDDELLTGLAAVVVDWFAVAEDGALLGADDHPDERLAEALPLHDRQAGRLLLSEHDRHLISSISVYSSEKKRSTCIDRFWVGDVDAASAVVVVCDGRRSGDERV